MLVIERHNAIICAYDVRVNTVSAAVIVNTGYEFELSGGVKSELQLDIVCWLRDRYYFIFSYISRLPSANTLRK